MEQITEIWPIDKVQNWQKNPREISPKGLKRLKKQIKSLGQYKPIIVNINPDVAPVGAIAGGNMRLKAMTEMGLDKVWVIPKHFKDEQEMIEVSLSDNDRAGWYLEAELVELLTDTTVDFESFSIDLGEPTILGDIMTKNMPADPKEDLIPEVRETDIKLGDMYILGDHILLCGDSVKREDVDKLMGEDKADLIFTDPPWNVNYGGADHPSWKKRTIENDNMKPEAWAEFCDKIGASLWQASKPGAGIYLVMSAQEWPVIDLALRKNHFHWSSTIIWAKDRLVLSRKDYHTRYEPIWYGWNDEAPRLFPLKDRKQDDVWEIKRPSVSDLHPTTKPIELVQKAIVNSSDSGSGSTLIACEKTKRKCRMMELDPQYVQVIVDRWEEFSGGKGILKKHENNA